MGWMPHAEGLCQGRRTPASQHLLPMCRGVLPERVLLLANQQLLLDIISWKEMKAKEGCQKELPTRAAMLSPAWRQRRGRAPATVPGGTWGVTTPVSPTTPQDTPGKPAPLQNFGY